MPPRIAIQDVVACECQRPRRHRPRDPHRGHRQRARQSPSPAPVSRCTDAGHTGPAWVADVCMLKNQSTRTMQFCADQAVQILGGMGFMRGTRVERIYREVKVMMVGGGSEEIMKDLAARQLGI